MSRRVSVIMPVLNRTQLVSRALGSILNQQVDGVEIIAVDGGSTDGTQEAIAAFPEVRLLDAPGSSIYEALNIGIRAARAPIIGHLNSDDRFLPGALDRVIAAARDPQIDIVRGQVCFVMQGADQELRPQATYNARVAEELDITSVLFGAPAINACFVKTKTYRRMGVYDETLPIAADREWLLRAVLSGATVALLHCPVYEYLIHPQSKTISVAQTNEAAYVREHLIIAERYLARPQTALNCRLLLKWHAHETVRLLVRGGVRRASWTDMARAFRISPCWPIRAIPPLLHTSTRRLQRCQIV